MAAEALVRVLRVELDAEELTELGRDLACGTLDSHIGQMIGLGRSAVDQTQNVRLNPQASPAEVRLLWDGVVARVRESGLMLGFRAEMPPKT